MYLTMTVIVETIICRPSAFRITHTPRLQKMCRRLVALATIVAVIVNVAEAAPASPDHTDNADAALEPRVSYEGAQMWRIPFDKQDERNVVADLQNNFDANLWNSNGSTVDLLLKEPALLGATRLLAGANVSYAVIIENLQRDIDAENPPAAVIQQLQNRQGHRMTWSAYHRTSDIHNYLEYLAKTYPDLCSVNDIGLSTEGRPLKVLRISNGNPQNAAIWLDGGIHAREWIGPAAVTYIINTFAEDWENQPSYIRNVDWYVLPMANPDGYEYAHNTDRMWRKNRGGIGRGRCAGVDLNRNFGYRWGGQGTSQQPCSEVYAGPSAFSEPESRAQKQFMDNSAANFKAFLTFHSYGQYILYPWGYDRVVPPDYKDLDRAGKDAAESIRRVTGKRYAVGASGTILYPAAGASDDWAKSRGIKYAYTVELRDSGRYGFILPASQIESASLEAKEMVFAIARAVAAE